MIEWAHYGLFYSFDNNCLQIFFHFFPSEVKIINIGRTDTADNGNLGKKKQWLTAAQRPTNMTVFIYIVNLTVCL